MGKALSRDAGLTLFRWSLQATAQNQPDAWGSNQRQIRKGVIVGKTSCDVSGGRPGGLGPGAPARRQSEGRAR